MAIIPLDEFLKTGSTASLVELEEKVGRELFGRFSHQPWGVEHFEKTLPMKESVSLVAIDGQCVCGYSIAYRQPNDTLHISRLIVDRGHRRSGIAVELISKQLDLGRHLGLRQVTVEVVKDNESARRLYERLGFRPFNPTSLEEYIIQHSKLVEEYRGLAARQLVLKLALL